MHELSLVMSIVEIAEQTTRQHGVTQVERIDLDIGCLAGIEFGALDFVWEAGVKDSVLEGAERIIHKIPGEGKCNACGSQFKMDNIFDCCPECENYQNEVLAGKELKVRSLIVN